MSARGVQLTERDTLLLTTLRELSVLTTAQVKRLLFASEQTTLRRLRRLQQAGHVRICRSAVAAHRLVTLSTAGDKIEGSRSIGPRSPMFLQHLLGVNEFRLALGQSCAARSDLELLGFISDRSAQHVRRGVPPNRLLSDVLGAGAHVPDGAFVLRRGGRSALFFFELDRGSEVVRSSTRGLGRIIHSYLQAFSAGTYQVLSREFGLSEPVRAFRALIVTTSPGRIASIRRLWGETPAAGVRFIWLAPDSALLAPDILRAGWVSLDPADARTYAIVSD